MTPASSAYNNLTLAHNDVDVEIKVVMLFLLLETPTTMVVNTKKDLNCLN